MPTPRGIFGPYSPAHPARRRVVVVIDGARVGAVLLSVVTARPRAAP